MVVTTKKTTLNKKKQTIMKAIKFLAIAMLMLVSTAMSANTSKNVNTNVSVSTSKIVDNKDVNFKTVYKKDAEGRVVNKVIYKSADGQWSPVGAYSIYYGEKENVLTYAQWDKKTKTFTLNAQQKHFDSKDYPIVMNAPEK